MSGKQTASNAPQQQQWHQGGPGGDYLNIKIFGVSGELSLILNVATVRHFKASNSIAMKIYKIYSNLKKNVKSYTNQNTEE